jgi:type II secretory pathway component PulK
MPLPDASRIVTRAMRETVGADMVNGQRGVALLIVLVTTAIMGAISTEFAYNTRTNIWMAGNVMASTQAYYHARSVSKVAELAVNAKRNFPQVKTVLSMMGKSGGAKLEIWRQACEFAKIFATGKASFFGLDILDLSEDPAVGFTEGDIECTITAEDSRTNLNAASTDPPSRLGAILSGASKAKTKSRAKAQILGNQRQQIGFKLFGLFRPLLESGEFDSEEEMVDLILNIMDWTDSDYTQTDVGPNGNFVDGGGSEATDYGDRDYEVKNAKMDTVGEAQLVAGMTSDIFCQIKDKLTVFSTGKLNINDADLATMKGVLCQALPDEATRMGLCWNILPGQIPVMDQALIALETCRSLKKQAYSTPFTSMSQFMAFVQRWPATAGVGIELPIDRLVVQEHLGVLTTMVRLEATGTYRGTKRKITTVYDQASGESVYLNIE